MLKRKIDKKAFDELDEAIKKLYSEKDGSYVLAIEGDDDAGELKRAKDREVQARKDAEKKAKELQEQLDEATGNDARKRGDIETLEKSWKEKFDKREKELLDKLSGKETYIRSTLVDNVATQLAAKISTTPNLMLPHIKARLAADFDGDTPVTRILDKDGKVSALSLEDLEKEFVANKDFSAIIVGSKASGSGTSKETTQKGQGSAPLDAQGKPISFRELPVAERVAYLQAKKQSNEG